MTADDAAPHRTTAPDRVARMLAMVPWIAANDGPTIDEICARFGLSRRKLEDELAVVTMVGVPPYTPDTLIEVTVDGDRVWLRFADVFARPLHLTPEQGLALVAAGQAAQEVLGGEEAGPLSSALSKVAEVLGIRPGDAISVALGETRPVVLAALRRAVSEHRRTRIDYYAYSRDERSTRDIDPYEVFAHEGSWYVRAHCHTAGGERLFRLDRVYDADLLDETFPTPPVTPPAGVFAPGPAVPRVTLDLDPPAQWAAEHYPVDADESRPDGVRRVTLPVASVTWLQRLLVRLGPDARVVEADDPSFAGAAADAARRMLVRYASARRPG
jgi:proteasome accessory factor C